MRGTIKQRLILAVMTLSMLFTVLPTMAIADDVNGILEFSTPSYLPRATVNTPYTTTIMASGGERPYKFSLLESSYVPDGFNLSEDGAITVTPTTGGTSYTNIVIRVTDNRGSTADRKFTLPVTAMWVNFEIGDNTFDYDGSSHVIEDIKPVRNGADLSGIIDYEVTYGGAASQTNAGTYPINIRVTTPGYASRSMDKTHMIINKSRNVNINFDDNVFFTYERGQQRTPGVSVQGRPTESDEWVNLDYTRLYEGITVDYSSSTPPSEPGVYRLSCTVNDSNYETPANNSINFEIQREVVNFTLNDQSPFYLGDEWNRAYEPSVEGFTDYTVEYVKDGVEHDTPTVSSGTYTVKITLGRDSRYQVGTITPAEFRVERTQADFVMDPASYEYTGFPIHPVITNSLGLVEGTDYELKYVNSDGQEIENPTEVGEYTVSIKNLKDSEINDNPALNGFKVSPEKFKITPRKIRFTVDNASWVYDNTEHTPKFTYNTSADLTGMYKVTYTKRGGDGTELSGIKDVGEYDIHITLLGDLAKNHTVDNDSSDLITVSPCGVYFQFTPDTFTYDGGSHTVEMTAFDVSAVVATLSTITKDEYTVQYRKRGELIDSEWLDSVKDVGEYDVIVTLKSDNYAIITPSGHSSYSEVGTVTVTPQELTFEVSDNTVPYDGNPHQATITPSVPTLALNTDYTVQYKDKNNNLTDSATAAGEYDIVINVINTNYSYTAQSFKMNITTTMSWNLGNSPAAMIYKDPDHLDDKEWQQSALNELRTNHSFSNFVPAQCEAGINYYGIYYNDIGECFDEDENTVIVNKLSDFQDPGIVVNGETIYSTDTPQPVFNYTPAGPILVEGLYEINYNVGEWKYTRYIAVVGKIGDVDGSGYVNGIDANYIDDRLIPTPSSPTTGFKPSTVNEARVWDVNKDNLIDEKDADAIRNRFSERLKPYYPWVQE